MRNHFAQLFLMGKRSEVVCFFSSSNARFYGFYKKRAY